MAAPSPLDTSLLMSTSLLQDSNQLDQSSLSDILDNPEPEPAESSGSFPTSPPPDNHDNPPAVCRPWLPLLQNADQTSGSPSPLLAASGHPTSTSSLPLSVRVAFLTSRFLATHGTPRQTLSQPLERFYQQQSAQLEMTRYSKLQTVSYSNHWLQSTVNSYYDQIHHSLIDRVLYSLKLLEQSTDTASLDSSLSTSDSSDSSSGCSPDSSPCSRLADPPVPSLCSFPIQIPDSYQDSCSKAMIQDLQQHPSLASIQDDSPPPPSKRQRCSGSPSSPPPCSNPPHSHSTPAPVIQKATPTQSPVTTQLASTLQNSTTSLEKSPVQTFPDRRYLPCLQSRHLNKRATSIMTQWYKSHSDHPYPSYDAAEVMANAGDITVDQVKKWFANQRRRRGNTKTIGQIAQRRRLAKRPWPFPPTSQDGIWLCGLANREWTDVMYFSVLYEC